MIIWFQFFTLTFIIAFFGYRLSILGDQISELTGLGRNIIGFILLSTVTSLPELVTGISAVTITKNPNLAVGDIMGSCCFNLATVVLLDLFYRQGSVYQRSTRTHIFMCLLGIILIGFTGFSMSLKDVSWFRLGNIGLYSLVIPVLYFTCVYAIFKFEPGNDGQGTKTSKSLTSVLFQFMFCSSVIVVCGIFLPQTAEALIELMGWNAAFVGTFFVALATSLPEISVTISALRINATELAFSNLLGSNIFNFMILAVDDGFYQGGPLLAAIDATHGVTAFSAVMVTGLVAIALLKPPQRKFFNIVSGMSALIILVYGINLFVSFKFGEN